MRYLGDRGPAEDLVQDVFTSVWKNADGFDPARASFATWLYRITPQQGDGPDPSPQRARAGPSEANRSLEPGEADPSGALSRSFDVAAALSRLSPVHREVLVLAYFGASRSVRSPSARTRRWARSRAAPRRRYAPCARPWVPTKTGGPRMSEHPEIAEPPRPLRDGRPGTARGAGGRGPPARMRRLQGGGARTCGSPTNASWTSRPPRRHRRGTSRNASWPGYRAVRPAPAPFVGGRGGRGLLRARRARGDLRPRPLRWPGPRLGDPDPDGPRPRRGRRGQHRGREGNMEVQPAKRGGCPRARTAGTTSSGSSRARNASAPGASPSARAGRSR